MRADTTPETSGLDGTASWEVYRRETAAILRQRLIVVGGLFTFFMGIGTVVESTSYPDRAWLSAVAYLAEVAVCVAGIVACWLPGTRSRPAPIGALVVGLLAALITAYHAAVHAEGERVAMVLSCVLNLVSVVFPLGWAGQLGAAVVTVASFLTALPAFQTHDAPTIQGVALLAGATTSVVSAFLLERHRFEAFRRSAMHAEEAEIAAALVHVGQTLGEHLGSSDMLARVNALAVAAIGCDTSTTFIFDAQAHAYRLASIVGATPEVETELAQLEFPPGSMPIVDVVTPGELLEIPHAERQSMIPPELLHHTNTASLLLAPIARRGETIGFLVTSFRERTGRFSRRERRLTLGIANAVAVALENARLIRDLQAASRLKSEFVATMSHELRTPLNVIIGYGEMLADGTWDVGSVGWKDTVARVQSSALELLELVNATLDLGRLEAGRETVAGAPVDVDVLLAELARELQPLVPATVVLSMRNDVGGAPIATDRVKLKTILKNLVGNALMFTPAGRGDVAADAGGDVLVLSVRDTGVGIARDQIPLIFEMFRQVDGSSTRRFSGVGLGLHIVERLVGLLGGTVSVESAVGAGSTFTVALPLRRVDRNARTGTG